MQAAARRAPILLWLALMAAGVVGLATHGRVVSDLSQFLPRGGTPVEQLLVEQLRSGATTRTLLVALEGAPEAALAALSKTLASRLRSDPAFSLVSNGAQALAPETRELLMRYRYLLSPGVTADRFETAALTTALKRRLRDLASPVSAVSAQRLARDPTAELEQVLHSFMGSPPASTRRGVWFTAGGERAVMLIQTRAGALDPEAQAQAIERIRQAFREANEGGGAKLVLSGPAVFALEARNSIRREATLLSILAAGAVMLLLVAVFRSLRLLFLFTVPILSGLVAGAVAVGAVFGGVHAITLAFGITLIGVALDYPVHLFAHRTPSEPPSAAMERIWPTLRLGAITTALGYSAMLFSGFDGLSQLGIFAIAGLIAAAAVTRWVLPALAPERGGFTLGPGSLTVRETLGMLRWLRWLPPVAAAAGLAYLVSLERSPWESDIANLSPLSAERLETDRELRAALGAPDAQKLLVAFSGSAEETLQQSEMLAGFLRRRIADRALEGFDAPSFYVPSKSLQRQRQKAIPPGDEIRRRMAVAAADLPFRDNLFRPFVAELAAARSLEPLEPEDLEGTVPGLKLQSLLFPMAGRWVALLPLRGVEDAAALSAGVAALDASNVHYLDLKAESNRLVTRYRDEALMLLAAGAAAIIVVLALGLRAAGTLFRVLMPVGASLVGVAALLVVLGERLSLFHIVALLLVAGVGLDYGLFFNRASAHPREREQTARALLVCSLSTVLVFSILATSDTPVLNAIGLTASAGTFLCMLFASALAPGGTRSARNHGIDRGLEIDT